MIMPDGQQKLVPYRTLEDRWYAYKQGGFAALHPKTRADCGVSRRFTPEQKQWVLEQAQTHLAVPITVLLRQWPEAEPALPSTNTVYRFLREHDLSAKIRRQRLDQPLATHFQRAPPHHGRRQRIGHRQHRQLVGTEDGIQ
jgi:hypothetical protein